MKRILVAGIGDAGPSGDGFAQSLVERLAARELPREAAVFGFGSGALDLAYEVMRGYDGVVLVDIGSHGGAAGALEVVEAAEAGADAGIEDGQALDPRGTDRPTVLRYLRTLGAWPGKVVVIACEPPVAADRAVDLVLATIEELRGDAAYAPAG